MEFKWENCFAPGTRTHEDLDVQGWSMTTELSTKHEDHVQDGWGHTQCEAW